MKEKPQNPVVVVVNGVKLMIDYAKCDVRYKKDTLLPSDAKDWLSDERSKLILCYLMDEGFFDEGYVKFQQRNMKTNKQN